MWEKSSNGSVAESVYVTDAIKNIYKSGVFRLKDAGGGLSMENGGFWGDWQLECLKLAFNPISSPTRKSNNLVIYGVKMNTQVTLGRLRDYSNCYKPFFCIWNSKTSC